MRKLTLLLAAAAVLASGCRPKARTDVFVDPALSILVPADTSFLAGVRMQKLQKTPAWQKHLANRQWPSVERFTRETGIDPRKDLWEVLIAGTPRGTVVFSRGKFSEMGMEPKAPYEGAKRFPYRGYTFVGEETYAITYMNSSTAMAGPVPLLKAIIDSREKKAEGLPSSLDPLVKAVPPGSHLWAAGQVANQLASLNPREHGTAGNFAQFARAIDTAWMGIDFSSGMKLAAVANCRTPQDADRLNSTVRAAVGLGRLNTPPERGDLLRAWDSIKSEIREGRTVAVNADLPQSEFDAWIGMILQRR